MHRFKLKNWKETKDMNSAKIIIPSQKNLSRHNNTPTTFSLGNGLVDFKFYVSKAFKDEIVVKLIENESCDLSQLGFHFQSYSFLDKKQCDNFYSNSKNEYKKWIVKPQMGSGGKGIHLLGTNEQYNCSKINKIIIQEFVSNPFLIDGFRFHVRFFLFIASMEPLRIYTAPRQSFLRRAAIPYNETIRESYVTNLSICRKIRSERNCILYDFQFVNKYISAELWSEAIALMSHISYNIIKSYLSYVQQKHKISKNKFHWFGFDFLMDENMKPKFIEYNTRPRLNTRKLLINRERGQELYNGIFEIVHLAHIGTKESQIQKIAEDYQFIRMPFREEE